MKTTIEIPDPLFRKAKSKAAERGQTLRQLFTEALQEKLAGGPGRARRAQPEWMAGFGELHRLRKETERIQSRIEEAFEVLEPEDRLIARIVPYDVESPLEVRRATRKPRDLDLPTPPAMPTDSLSVLLQDRASR